METKYTLSQNDYKRICTNTAVNAFVALVRANNYPNMYCCQLDFEGFPFYAICTKNLPNDPYASYDFWVNKLMRRQRVNFSGEELDVERFEGGAYVQYEQTFMILVDKHLYYVTFYEL